MSSLVVLSLQKTSVLWVWGKKTLENEILKEAVEYAAEKKWIARSPLLPGEDQ